MSILDTLKTLNNERYDDIERWLAEKRKEAAPYIYTSVDLRHALYKLAPVDTNLYPAGFQNLSPQARARATRFFARYLEEHYPKAKRLLIVPENHTRNLAYRENIVTLQTLLAATGADVRLGSLAAASGQAVTQETPSGQSLTEYPLKREGNMLGLEDGFVPDLIVLNNDMTSGVPELLKDLTQPIVPPPEMGWWQRRKSQHFTAYQSLVKEFGEQFQIDPWLLAAEFHFCGRVDFKQQVGLDCAAKAVEQVLARVREKYKQYGISDEPYVFIKADSGTYGMGIMTAHSPDDVLNLNKKTRNKMQVIKEGTHVSEVIIQEGVPTVDVVDGKPAEPMVYLVDGVPTGGMYRVNSQRTAFNNLNAAGMEFTGMCDEIEDECGKWKTVEGCDFRSFGLVAALAALAAARERYSLPLDGGGQRDLAL